MTRTLRRRAMSREELLKHVSKRRQRMQATVRRLSQKTDLTPLEKARLKRLRTILQGIK